VQHEIYVTLFTNPVRQHLGISRAVSQEKPDTTGVFNGVYEAVIAKNLVILNNWKNVEVFAVHKTLV